MIILLYSVGKLLDSTARQQVDECVADAIQEVSTGTFVQQAIALLVQDVGQHLGGAGPILLAELIAEHCDGVEVVWSLGHSLLVEVDLLIGHPVMLEQRRVDSVVTVWTPELDSGYVVQRDHHNPRYRIAADYNYHVLYCLRHILPLSGYIQRFFGTYIIVYITIIVNAYCSAA